MLTLQVVYLLRSITMTQLFNTLRQNGRHLVDNIFKYIFVNENV